MRNFVNSKSAKVIIHLLWYWKEKKLFIFKLISKANQPVKEEQLSEAWSLDADPPESVMNDPLDDNTVNSRLNSSSSINTEAAVARKSEHPISLNPNITTNSNNNNNNNLICFDTNSENVNLFSI